MNKYLLVGEKNRLKINRYTDNGVYLICEDQDEVLLPNQYVSYAMKEGDEIDAFVYFDSEDRIVASTVFPKAMLDEFGCFEVVDVTPFGAFLDWGLEKDLFVPFKEQARPMEQGKRYLVYMYADERTNRLVASSKTNQFLSNDEVNLEKNEEVDLIISHITDLGINVIINEKHKGLVYKDETFVEVKPGQRCKGYIKNVRPDGKIDVSFQKLGYDAVEPNAQKILNELQSSRGFLRLSDNSHPEDIKTVLQMSKKTFKKAIGLLYKEKLIEIKDDGIYLIK